MKPIPTILLIACLVTIGAISGTAQTLTTTFNFTASGLIGTPATAAAPFQGTTFNNAQITITTTGQIEQITLVNGACYTLPNTSASVTIQGIGSYYFVVTLLKNCPTVDPIKGVTANTIYLETAQTASSASGTVSTLATNIAGTTAWDMSNSFGPHQTHFNWPSLNMATSGGILLFTGSGGSSGTFQATSSGSPPPPLLTRSGVLAHIAAGGGWSTVMTLVNTSSVEAPVKVALYDDNGSALPLPLATRLNGVSQTITTASLEATIKPNATLLISTGDQLASTVVGWADVLSTAPLKGYVIFRATPQSGSPSEGTVPLELQFPSSITLPYDNAGGFVMGVALANLSTLIANVDVTMWDDNGNQLATQNLSIPKNGHMAFVLPDQFPITVGRRGVVKFRASGGITGLGLRFSPFGTFTSVPTM